MDAHLRSDQIPGGASVKGRKGAIDPAELRALLSSLSHELCRPLASLRAGFDLLLRDPAAAVSKEQRGHLESMTALCDSLLSLTRGYLDYAGMVNSARALSLGAFSIRAIVRELDRQFRGPAAAAGLRWETTVVADADADPSAKADESMVVTDATLCQQVFGNLVSNAIKYTPPGGSVRVEAQSGPDEWCVSVTDDGPGIPPDSVDRVFDPFYRLPRDEHSRIEGNGLGLCICRELVERLSGTIVLDSTLGVGTTVKVHFSRELSTKEPMPAR